jgi:hypothetical protein
MPEPQDTPTTHADSQTDEQMLLAFVATRDVRCPACGYNLRQLHSNTCPECGNALRLSVGLVDSVGRAWITALVAALIPAGCGLPFLVAITIALFSGASWSAVDLDPGITIIILYTAGCLVGALLLLTNRRIYMRQSKIFRNTVATSIVLADAAWVIGILAYSLWLLS